MDMENHNKDKGRPASAPSKSYFFFELTRLFQEISLVILQSVIVAAPQTNGYNNHDKRRHRLEISLSKRDGLTFPHLLH